MQYFTTTTSIKKLTHFSLNMCGHGDLIYFKNMAQLVGCSICWNILCGNPQIYFYVT